MSEQNLNFSELGADQLTKIYHLTQQMTTLSDEENILAILLDELMQETGAEVGAFIYFNPETKKFEPRKVKTFSGTGETDIRFSSTVFNQVLASKEAVLSFDTHNDTKYQDTRSVIMNEIHAILAFPLIINGNLYGIMYFDSRRNRQGFNEQARQFLSFFSITASLALEQVLKKEAFEKENLLLKNQLEQTVEIPEMAGESPAMQKLFRMIYKVAQSDVPVIISGENGTGKDLTARAIHNLSARKENPFIAQYIGSIPETLVESELFGYKKGAFTGAGADKKGLFEAASGGTLFLDEIGDLSLELQVKLLRVLQNQEIRRLGENTVRKIDVRIITASNKNLAELVHEGRFREDLYYRLNVINIEVPPLRSRATDIPILARHFLKDTNFEISKAALKKLMDYHWPGNVRQLDNILKRASVLASGSNIEGEDIQLDSGQEVLSESGFSGTMEEIKNQIIRHRIQLFNGNKTRAAKSLNISLRSLQSKAKELGL